MTPEEIDSALYAEAIMEFLEQFEMSPQRYLEIAASKEKLMELDSLVRNPRAAPQEEMLLFEEAKDLNWWETMLHKQFFEELDRTDVANEDYCMKLKKEYAEWRHRTDTLQNEADAKKVGAVRAKE